MPESLLAVLKLCALALLYLFFLRVIRAVWAEVSPAREAAPAAPRPTKPNRRRSSAGAALVVVEPKEQKGHRHSLGEETTLGRAAGCTITLSDTYASQLHARVFRREGALLVEDLGSTNGTYLNGRKVTRAAPVKRGDLVKIGGITFEVDA